MIMRVFIAFTFVIVLNTVAIGQGPVAGQNRESLSDPDAYRIYATLLPQLWATRSKDALLLQQETETVFPCDSSSRISDPEWLAVANRFRQENSRPKVLQAILQIPGQFRLIPKAVIEADDARLKLKYPGTFNRLPESIEYAAVSAVGFNSNKTKAMVHVRLRSGGDLHLLERRGDDWIHSTLSGGCAWIV